MTGQQAHVARFVRRFPHLEATRAHVERAAPQGQREDLLMLHTNPRLPCRLGGEDVERDSFIHGIVPFATTTSATFISSSRAERRTKRPIGERASFERA